MLSRLCRLLRLSRDRAAKGWHPAPRGAGATDSHVLTVRQRAIFGGSSMLSKWTFLAVLTVMALAACGQRHPVPGIPTAGVPGPWQKFAPPGSRFTVLLPGTPESTVTK